MKVVLNAHHCGLLGVELWLHSFINSALDGGESSVLLYGRLTFGPRCWMILKWTLNETYTKTLINIRQKA